MGWLIVLAALAMVVGSVTLVRPSKTEQRQMKLRQEALAKGLRVRMRQLQVPGDPETRNLAVYTLPRGPEQREALVRDPACWLAVRAPGGGLDSISADWQFLESDPAARRQVDKIAALLAGLSEEVLAVTSQPAVAGVYWTEAGKTLEIDEIATFLQHVLELGPPQARA